MGKLGKKYQILIGEPCRCYFKSGKGEYNYMGNGYYVGKGYCVTKSFTDVRDDLNNGIRPHLIKYDRYIPMRLWNEGYGTNYEWNGKRMVDNNRLHTPDYALEDFNTDVLEDWYYGHLDEFWWWKEIQKDVNEKFFEKSC